MELEQVLNFFSQNNIVTRDNITVYCSDGNSYSGKIIERNLIANNNHEIQTLIHNVDGKNYLCLKNRPDGFGPDTADDVIYLNNIVTITKP
jgi:hypothetical protein